MVVRIERFGATPLRLTALSAMSVIAALTHYLAIPAELAMGIYILARFRGPMRTAAFTAMTVAGILFLIIGGPLLWAQRENFSANLDWLADEKPGLIWRTLERLATLPLQYFLAPAGTGGKLRWIGAALYLLPLMALRRRDLLIWVLLGGAIIGTTALCDVVQHREGLSRLRMTVAAAPAFYVAMIAVASSLPRRRMVHAMGAAIVLCCLIALPDAYQRPLKPHWRQFAARFDQFASPQDVLVVPFESRKQNWEDALMLVGLQRYSVHPDRPVLVLSEPLTPQVLAQLRAAPGAWFLTTAQHSPVDWYVPGAGGESSMWAPGAGSLMKLTLGSPPATAKSTPPSPPP
jgi:hypothetical protein